jgi:hypothetical protein
MDRLARRCQRQGEARALSLIVAVLITSNSLYGLPTLDGFTDAFVALGAFLLIAAFAARAVVVQSAARTTN